MIITGKAIGSRRPLFGDWSCPIPPNAHDGDGLTLRVLIESIVRQQLAAFRKRQQDGQFIRALSADQIDEAARRGKVDSGGSEIELQEVDTEHAVQNAWQAFEDGIYLVAIDDQKQESLDQQIYLTEDSRITFIRLTMLTGG